MYSFTSNRRSSSSSSDSISGTPASKKRRLDRGAASSSQPSGVSAPAGAPAYYHLHPDNSGAATAPRSLSAGEQLLSPGCKHALDFFDLLLTLEKHQINSQSIPVGKLAETQILLEEDKFKLSWLPQHVPPNGQALIATLPKDGVLYEKFLEVHQSACDMAALLKDRETIQRQVEENLGAEKTDKIKNGTAVPTWDEENKVLRLVDLQENTTSSLPAFGGDEGAEWQKKLNAYRRNSIHQSQEIELWKTNATFVKNLQALQKEVPLQQLEGKWDQEKKTFQIWHRGSEEAQPTLSAERTHGEALEKCLLWLTQIEINRYPYANIRFDRSATEFISQYRSQNGDKNPTPLKLSQGVGKRNFRTEFKSTLMDFYDHLKSETHRQGASSWLHVVDTLPKFSKLLQAYQDQNPAWSSSDQAALKSGRSGRAALNLLCHTLFGELPTNKIIAPLREDPFSFFHKNGDQDFRNISAYADMFDRAIAAMDIPPGDVYKGRDAAKNFVEMMKIISAKNKTHYAFLSFMLNLRNEIHPFPPLDRELREVLNKNPGHSWPILCNRLALALPAAAIALGKSSAEVSTLLMHWDDPQYAQKQKEIEAELIALGVPQEPEQLETRDRLALKSLADLYKDSFKDTSDAGRIQE